MTAPGRRGPRLTVRVLMVAQDAYVRAVYRKLWRQAGL